ncbi:MAG: EAL domain-containing protein [Nitrospiraceae bacterium]|nr:EAL domain-containing protein [Nitrospiraceae bacterium]
MKRKIVQYLLSLFVFFATGSVLTALYISNTTVELSRLIRLHEIENLRQHLVISLQTVQTDLYTLGTPLSNSLDSIVSNVNGLERSAHNCLSCHHNQDVAGDLGKLQVMIRDYKEDLSQYITASANMGRIDTLKLHAAQTGNVILMSTETMSRKASETLRQNTISAMEKVKRAKTVLYVTVGLSFLLGLAVAARLTVFITRPVNELVKGARAIALGDVGYTVPYTDKTEFGELVGVFNRMSVELENGYTKLHDEIIERKKIEEALRQSEERYVLASRGANDGLWDWNLRQGRIYLSSRWKAMLGYQESELGDEPKDWFERVHADDREHLEAKVAAHIEGNSSHLECEYRIRHRDGTYRWMLSRGLAVRDITGTAYRMAGSQTDITERKVAEEQLIHDAFHDALTGLPNRALFMDRLHHRFRQMMNSRQRGAGFLFAILFIDLDRFKVINDSLGHVAGDHLLVAVSQRLSQGVRPGDTVARLGGDEFAVILEEVTDREHAEQITGRIQKEMPKPFYIDGNEVFTTASIGIALSSGNYRKPEEMIRDADIAMYQAKSKGKAHHAVFEEGMYTTTVERMHLETDLRRAVEHGEFILHYQPIMELTNDSLVGFEALVRWNHPKKGLVYPMEFIPVAEETGLIFPLGEWILRSACNQLREWQREYPRTPSLKMSVNISSRQFLQPDLTEMIAQVLRANQLEAGSLTIEITESMIMEDIDSAIESLNQLRSMGIHIHIDDFGTGYSSLSYIHRFPVHALKIDRSFVEKMHSDEDNLQIVKAIVMLAHNLKLELIAEGLETAVQLDQLKELNCHYGQGFFLSRPMDTSAIEAYLKRNLGRDAS